MSITETLGALGSWEIQLRDETPDYILDQLGFFGHVAIADGSVDVAAVGAGLLTGARYVGVLRAKDKTTGRKLSGSGMVFWLGDEDGKGDLIETQISLTAATLSTAVHAILDPSTAVDVGTINSAAGTYTGKHQFQTRREALGIICDAFNVEFRVNGNGTVDVGTAAQLYNIAAPDTIVVRRAAGADMGVVALGGDYEVQESVYDFSTRVVLLGQTVGTGDTPDVVFATGSANASSVPYLDLFGNSVKIVRPISESGTTTGSVAARAQLQLNRFNRTTRSLKITAEDYETEGNFVVGDNVYVYDPDTGIVNSANEVLFRGEVLHPDVVRASGITWPVVQGMTVAFRTQAGAWLDLTPFVTWETAGNELTVGDLPQSLTKSGDNLVQVRLDASLGQTGNDTSIPNAPTSLTLTTSSALNTSGQTISIIHASWTAPTLNTDASVLTDLSHYLVEYRPQYRSPQWQEAPVTADVQIDLAVTPSLPYDLRVAAVDNSGHISAWTSTGTITSAADAIAPNAPADPVVTSYLGQLRIEYAGTDSTGNPMAADTNRIDVHVGTTNAFTATTATRVSSITPFAKGVAYATAPYSTTDNRWVRLIAVDHSGNASASSAVVGGHTVQVADGDVASMSVGKLTAGTMTADVITSGRFTTALTGARREMNAVGFQAYNASNVLTINLDGVNNLLTGIYKTALTGRRIEIGATPAAGEIKFIPPTGATGSIKTLSFDGTTEMMSMGMPIAGKSSFWNTYSALADQLATYAPTVGVIFGGTDTNTAYYVDWIGSDPVGTTGLSGITAQSRIIATNTDVRLYYDVAAAGHFQVNEYTSTTILQRMEIANNGVTFNLTTTGSAFLIYDHDDLRLWLAENGGMTYYASTGGIRADWRDTITYMWHGPQTSTGWLEMGPGDISSPAATYSSNYIGFYTPESPAHLIFGGRLKYARYSGGNPGIEVLNADASGFDAIKASAFVVSSSETVKDNIRDFGAGAMDKLRPVKVKRFHRKGTDAGVEEIGVIAEQMPDDLRLPGGDLGPMVSLTAQVAMQLAALQELDARLDLLETKGVAV